jgi:hypothetical protein
MHRINRNPGRMTGELITEHSERTTGGRPAARATSARLAEVRRVRLAAPPCTIGITDGSERGDYVPQSHILKQMGRPHHVVNLMFQYYPDMKGWPTQGVKWHGFYRNNNLNKGDGYFPLVLEDGGRWGQLYLRQIEDVRAHGQEPQLTLTIHCNTPDEVLVRIAESLRPYTPMRIRINHECNGTWFHFNQRWTYKQVSDFFVRFHKILHLHAPGVTTVACWNGPGDTDGVDANDGNTMRGQLTGDQLGPMFLIADIISFDQYASLHYGWPNPGFDRKKPSQFFKVPFELWWKHLENFHAQICNVRGGEVDVEIHEINEDAALVGLKGQAEWTTRFYAEVLHRRFPWLTNITFYQFRDRGGLGLELEDAEDATLFKPRPALAAYRKALSNDHFAHRVEPVVETEAAGPFPLEWRSSTDSDGFEFSFHLPANTRRVAAQLPADTHLLVGIGNQWQVKTAGTSRLSFELERPGDRVNVRVFAPPSDGRNNTHDSFRSSLATPPALTAR